MLKRLSTIIAGAILGLIFLAAPVSAKEAPKPAVWLQISPVSNRVSLVPEQSLEYNFTVENIGAEDFSYKIYAGTYTASGEDYNISFTKETKRTQLQRWIKFKNTDGSWADHLDLSLAAGKKQVINYQVTVPKDLPAGGQYATIFAEAEPNTNGGNTSGIKAISRVGLLVFGSTSGNTRHKAEITDYHLDSFLTKGQISATAKVKNSGNTDFATRHKFTVQSLFGKEIFNKEIVYDVLPATERRVRVKWDKTPHIGIYKVSYKVSALDKKQSETKIVLIMPVTAIVILLMLLTLSIIWIIILFRKRKQRKSKLIV